MRVLLATDDSNEARQATVWLRDVPLPPGTVVGIVAVATLTRPPPAPQSLTRFRELLRTLARRAGESAAALLEARWPSTEIVIAVGDPQVEILHVAEQSRVDMVVVGTRRLGRLQRWLGTSTSLAIVRHAPCPVAVVQGEPRRLTRVLVAVDGSTISRAAVDFLSRFDLTRETKVILLHVLGPAQVQTAGLRETDQRTQAMELLAGSRARLGELRCEVEPMVATGNPASEIVRIARESDVDLVVLGTRRLRELARFFRGSVSEAVLYQSSNLTMIIVPA